VLNLRGVNVFYGRTQVLHNIFIKIKAGGIVSVTGTGGAGKSTLLQVISGIIRSRDGVIRFGDRDITHSTTAEIVHLGISQVLQGGQLFPYLSVLDNLKLGAYFYHNRKFKTDIEEKLDRIYQVFPILHRRSKQLAWTLSGGEQQMAAIGRALMARPNLLLLDEPSRGLPPLIVRDIFRVIRRLNDQGITILLAEQNLRTALQVAHYGYVLENGAIALEGPAEELLADDKVGQVYLGG
jgi:branched-chain amino acid transport system ATP-binding protein